MFVEVGGFRQCSTAAFEPMLKFSVQVTRVKIEFRYPSCQIHILELKMASILTKKWTLLTWLLVVVWFGLSAWGNCPIGQQHPSSALAQYDLRGYWVDGTKMGDPDYHYTALVGWPFKFVDIDHPDFKPARFNLWLAIANAVTIFLSIVSVVYLSQRFFSRFSIRAIGAVTGVVATACAVGGLVIPDYGLPTFIYVMLSIYLSPLLLMACYCSIQISAKRCNSARDSKIAI